MKTKQRRKERSKWTAAIVLIAAALLTVILCAASGAFHFANKVVTPNDAAASAQPEPTEDAEEFTGTVYTVFVSAGNGGKADPSGGVKVKAEADLTLHFAPEEGYILQSVTVDGAEVGTEETYTLKNVTSDHSVVAAFAPIPDPAQQD